MPHSSCRRKGKAALDEHGRLMSVCLGWLGKKQLVTELAIRAQLITQALLRERDQVGGFPEERSWTLQP